MKKRKTIIHLGFSEQSTADLRGRQSVRTTFKLSERAIEALSILAGQLGIKQKSLFDHLVEDTQVLRAIAEEFTDLGPSSERVAKTYVVSRRSLENLERVSVQYGTPRDALVEYSIERILPLLAEEKKKHKRRKMLFEEMKRYLKDGIRLIEEAEKDLGSNDPAMLELLHMVRSVDKCCENIQGVVRKGSKIEEF